MIERENEICDCKIKGKKFDENDEICIKCKNGQKLLDVIFEIAMERATKNGDTALLEAFFKNMPM